MGWEVSNGMYLFVYACHRNQFYENTTLYTSSILLRI